MEPILNSPSKEHLAILDVRLASYRAGKWKPISHAELMRRVRAPEKIRRPRKTQP